MHLLQAGFSRLHFTLRCLQDQHEPSTVRILFGGMSGADGFGHIDRFVVGVTDVLHMSATIGNDNC